MSKRCSVTSQQLKGQQRFKKMKSVPHLLQEELVALKLKTNPAKQRLKLET